jgi:hypothetical protein
MISIAMCIFVSAAIMKDGGKIADIIKEQDWFETLKISKRRQF